MTTKKQAKPAPAKATGAMTSTGATTNVEAVAVHTRLLKCTLELDSARAWWRHPTCADDVVESTAAFEQAWFGPRSLERVKVLLGNMRARFDAFPEALAVLRVWEDMEPSTRQLVCHWHLQLSDPLYRAFTGEFLVARHDASRPEVTRDMVTAWVGAQGPGRWTMRTRIQFASQLLVSAKAAGLVENLKDPRRLVFPRVDDVALEYLLYLLRGVSCARTMLDNAYVASVGFTPHSLDDRLRRLPSLRFSRQGDVVDFGWRYPSLSAWATASLPLRAPVAMTGPVTATADPTYPGRGAA